MNKQIRGWLENGGSLTRIKLYKKHLWLVILEEHTKSFPTVCVCACKVTYPLKSCCMNLLVCFYMPIAAKALKSSFHAISYYFELILVVKTVD